MEQQVKLYLIRHGRPSAGFAEAMDPGLDEVGRSQAEAVAQELAPLGPLSLVTSPLRRARDTAMPFETLWKVSARIEPAEGEFSRAELGSAGSLRVVARSVAWTVERPA